MQCLNIIIGKFHSLFCRIWNAQYYMYTSINSNVVFAASFPGMVKIVSPERCVIGTGTVINADSVIHCAGGVLIGSYVHVGHGLCVYSSNHNYASDKSIPYDDRDILNPVEIRDYVWIGAKVSIVPGVKIGEGAVVGMGAVVTCDVPDGAIVGGNPAKILGYRDMEIFQQLKLEGKFV